MPNSETHLAAASDLLAQPDMAQAYPWLAGDECQAAFLMGAISPDVRAIIGQPREATHFFNIPPTEGHSAPEMMCADWPQISQAVKLNAPGAAFVAGYMTHLIMDQTWVEMIVIPGLYVAGLDWGIHHPNWRLYCILMTYLEYRAAGRLPADSVRRMAGAKPVGWLPFVADHWLVEWRSRVVKLIESGGPRIVSRALTKSCGLSLDEMEAIVLSEPEMTRQAYPVVARERLLNFEVETARRCRDQVLRYLVGTSEVFS